ncbi:MAG: hypothetical protein M3377_02435 [Actinomycetota bacterium]|nr:hypothetical protein [Actinomycetota bacterium]
MSPLQDDLAAVSPEAAAAYLTVAGWERTNRGELGERWRYAGGARVRNVALPGEQLDQADRATMLARVLRVLEEVESRPLERIAADLRDADRDVVRFRVVAPGLTRGELPLTSAPEMLAGAREALRAAGRAEVGPRAFYSGGQVPTPVLNLLDGARVGPTEAGSVIVNVLSKLELTTRDHAQGALVSEAERPPVEVPFARRALRRLLSGVRAAKSASHRDATELDAPDAFDDDIQDGLSANLCEALTDLATKDDAGELDAQVTVDVRWALSYPSDEPRTLLEMTTPELKTMNGIATRLRNITPIVDQQLSGYVRELSREPGQDDGMVRVSADIEGRLAVVKLHLAAPDYDTALRAHGENREIEFTGTLEKAGKIWEITAPTAITIRS